jgi:S-formylglutathione hydrolase FrmB
MAVFDITLFSNTLHRQIPLTAIIPIEEFDIPGFPKIDKSKPFRALYLLHGFSGTHTDWLRGSRIEQLAMMHNIAVFCPSGENSFYLDDKVRDALYEQYICKELVDFTRRIFPISREKKDTAIGGLSMGGYGAIHSGLKYPDVFGSIIALSSALITENVAKRTEQANNPMISVDYFAHTFGKPEEIIGSHIDPKALAKKLTEAGAVRPNLYLACGTEDFLIEPNRELHQYLTEIGYEHIYLEGAGIHDWVFWDSCIEKALLWLDSMR